MMAPILAGPIRRLRSLELRQALFVFLAASLVAVLAGLAFPTSTALAQAGTPPAVSPAPSGDTTEATQLLNEMRATARIVKATMVLVDATIAQDPSADEMAALRAQVAVVTQRVARVGERVREAQASLPAGAAGPVQPNAAEVDSASLEAVLRTSQEVVELLRSVVVDPAADPASLELASGMLQEIEALLIPVRDILAAQLASGGVAPASATPSQAAGQSATLPGASEDLALLAQLAGVTRLLGLVVAELPPAAQVDAVQAPLSQAPVPAAQAAPAPAPIPDPNEDLAWLSQLAQITRQLGLVVAALGPQSGTGAGAAGALAPAPATQPATSPNGSAPMAAPAPTPAPMGGMMAHMQNMMSMMGGMMGGGMGGMMGGGSGAMSGGAAGMAAGGPAADTRLKREAHTAASMITVQPLNLGATGLATMDFYVTLDSHGGSLFIDLPSSTRLRTPSGVEIAPLRWTGPSTGQHIEGTLSFPLATLDGAPAIPPAGLLTLVVASPAVSGAQLFSWDLGQVQ